MPALPVRDAHPDRLTDSSLRVLIPLRDAHEQYRVIDDFLEDLAAFAAGRSDRLLRTLEAAPSPTKMADDLVNLTMPVVPGVIGVNLKAAARHLRAWWFAGSARGA